MSGAVSGRELQCVYKSRGDFLWPSFQFCWINEVDFSANFEAEKHTFTGTPSQKSETKNFEISRAAQIDFIPRDILAGFPNLNGIGMEYCNLSTVKEGLFKEELQNIEYLWLAFNQIEVIEPKAFQYLVKLQWVSLYGNKIQALPDRIFQNNPDLIYIDLERNKISSIVPNFFDGLNKFKRIELVNNVCVSTRIGCESCLITQAELKKKLRKCFSN
jgi:Leucine-rich repeat (LRR) protein